MPQLQKSDQKLTETPDLEEEDEEEEEEKREGVDLAGKETREENSGQPEDVLKSSPGEKSTKSVKSDLSVLIVNENDKKLSRTEGEVEVQKNGKGNEEEEEEDGVPPALPPRPPPRPRQPCTCTCASDGGDLQEREERRVPRSCWSSGLRKYVFLCTACGSLSILLGALFLTVYFMLKSYTSSLNHFETIPTYVPSGMLIATGFLIICLACRKNRNSFLMKLCGLCSLCCAVLCVSVTVTTTVIHMNRLQTLRECLYTLKTQSCTCYSVLMDNDRMADEGIKFVFNSTPDCEVIHGALYSCLRAIFGLSVIGILVCIFSCMLVYQLLSHEKKKMYWAQLEMRCRYLYRQQRNPHYYSCCDECRYPPHPHELFPWDLMANRFWSTGRIGNLYTPNPEDRGNHNRLRSGWNWRRLPWTRSGGNSNEPTRASLGSPDSQYGFSSTPAVDGAPYTVLDPRTPAGLPGMAACHAGLPPAADITEGGFYSWGPPPPYASNRNSANNSPARRSLGDILHQMSPIRRNDNVSPARALHHVHRHHLHHNRQCGSTSRQGANNPQSQSDSLQKTTPLRSTPITNAIQQQQAGMDPLWSNSLSSVHQFQKVIQNKANYENMYETENVLPNTGFNTLPSLKKRNQTRVSEIFQDETSTAYFFSSAENLGCSTSNVEVESRGETLPPRVFLTGGQANPSRYAPANGSALQSHASKSQNDLNASESSKRQQPSHPEGTALVLGSRPFRSTDRNASLVRKLFVNCSPTKQKPRNAQDAQAHSAERPENPGQTPRKKLAKKSATPKDSSGEAGSENVITFHYRVGIPRSPNIQNFNQFVEKSSGSVGGGESWPGDKIPESEVSQSGEVQKAPKGMKYLTKDVELLQKHSSLIKEFNQNIDLQKNLKYRSGKADPKKNVGAEKENLQPTEDSPREAKHFQRSFHSNVGRRNPGSYPHGQEDRQTNETGTANEDYLPGNLKTGESESDVYFGDISNSSCYMSLQNDGLESLLYEDAEGRSSLPRFSTGVHSLLNKQNLKMIEDDALGYDEILPGREAYSEGKQHPESSSCGRHQSADAFQQNYRCRHGRPSAPQHRFNPDQGPEDKSEEFGSLRPSKQDKSHEAFGKSRRFFGSGGGSHYGEATDGGKYFTPHASRGLQDHFRQPEHHQESINSNDELSSGSLTADSGISSGRSFVPGCFDNPYREGEARSKGDPPGEKFPSFGSKIPCLENLGDFSHPLFQKPKALPRGSRYKETETRQRKKLEPEESESGNDGEPEAQTKRKRSAGNAAKLKGEEVSNQLLNTCNLSLNEDSDRFLEEGRRYESLTKSQEDLLSGQKEDSFRKSPKPLPRTSVSNRIPGDGLPGGDHGFEKGSRFAPSKEKLGHFLAPDAQYEFQENFKPDSKQKSQGKGSEPGGGRSKPAVPARPLNLQKSPKGDGVNVQMYRSGPESVCPVPRRRGAAPEESDRKENVQMGTHSVNV